MCLKFKLLINRVFYCCRQVQVMLPCTLSLDWKKWCRLGVLIQGDSFSVADMLTRKLMTSHNVCTRAHTYRRLPTTEAISIPASNAERLSYTVSCNVLIMNYLLMFLCFKCYHNSIIIIIFFFFLEFITLF